MKGRVTGKTFYGSRVAVQLAVGEHEEATMRAYVDTDLGQAVGSDPVWVSWDAENMAILND